MPKLSVTVITKDEARNLPRALESVRWADELIVIDSHSSDETVAIAKQFTDRVIVRDWAGYSEQKNHAADVARHDWILSIDADERVSDALRDELKALLARDPEAAGYRAPRVSRYLGRWIRHTDWYPDYQLRLYDRRVARWAAQRVHESVTVEGAVRKLTNTLEHFPYRDISHHLQTIDRYTTLAARDLRERGTRAGVLDLAVHPPLAFLRNYLLRGGILDGLPGFMVSILNSYYVFLKFAKLWELQSQHNRSTASLMP